MTERLRQSIESFRGIGPVRRRQLAEAGIFRGLDLLFHLPRRYEDRTRISNLAELEEGEHAVVGAIQDLRSYRIRRGMTMVKGTITGGGNALPAIWFNRPYLKRQVSPDGEYLLYGRVRRRKQGLEMLNASCEPIDDGTLAGRIVPVYTGVGGLAPALVRRLIRDLLDEVDLEIELAEYLPQGLIARHGLQELGAAVAELHSPGGSAEVEALNEWRSPAHRRLIYGEFLRFQVELASSRAARAEVEKSHRYSISPEYVDEVANRLPFSLTTAQRRAAGEILSDLRRRQPMSRLLQGDVGCGKTVIAAIAMLAAAQSGLQAAFMAPTELLAEQHFQSLRKLIASPHELVLLTSSSGSDGVRQALARGDVRLAVGTHALIQDQASFSRLGLVVIDEQHRFGVKQRRGLQEKGTHTDVLVMTATPIPRSLTLTAYGDLDVSVIDELPAGRKPITTRVRSIDDRNDIYGWLSRQLAEGDQAYVVVPRIDVDDTSDLPSIATLREELSRWLPDARVEIVHGRMTNAEREDAMQRFSDGRAQLLLATTIIEVGIDVPGATIMVIEGAETFGLAQLHQLRGRVGRGERDSSCVAIFGSLSPEGEERLAVFGETNDGFRIAEKDLHIRGPGDLLGTRQSGAPIFRVASVVRDQELLQAARRDADSLLTRRTGEAKRYLSRVLTRIPTGRTRSPSR